MQPVCLAGLPSTAFKYTLSNTDGGEHHYFTDRQNPISTSVNLIDTENIITKYILSH